MVIVIVLPLTQLVVEQVDVIRDAVLVQQLIELLVIDPMGSFDLAVEVRRPWADVHMADVQRLKMPVKLRLKLRAVISLNDVDAKWQSPHDFVGEVDSRALVARVVDLEDPNAP